MPSGIGSSSWHGLVVLIALGETIVSIGNGAAGLALDAHTIGAVVLSLVLSAALWYFDHDDERAAGRLLAIAPEARTRIGIVGYWYAQRAT